MTSGDAGFDDMMSLLCRVSCDTIGYGLISEPGVSWIVTEIKGSMYVVRTLMQPFLLSLVVGPVSLTPVHTKWIRGIVTDCSHGRASVFSISIRSVLLYYK